MEFIALPAEFIIWLEEVIADSEHWTLIWHVRRGIYSIASTNDLGDYGNEQNPYDVQFFVGNRQLSERPRMLLRDDGKEQIDFVNSLCVQVIPPFVVGDVLLEGNVKALPPRKYVDIPLKREFVSWKRRLFRWFEQKICEKSAVVTQVLTNGEKKELRGVIISLGAIEWHRSGGKLKQFYDGSVEFIPKQRNI